MWDGAFLNRRDFLGRVATGAGALVLPHVGMESLLAAAAKTNNIIHPRTAVGIARSPVSRVQDMDFSDVKAVVSQAVNRAGGLKEIVRDGHTVILKPNLMCLYINSSGEKLYPKANGITTDYRVTRAVAQLVRELNPDSKIYVAESSAFQQTRPTMAALNYTKKHLPEVDGFIFFEESGKYEQWDSPKLTTVTLPKDVGIYPDSMKPNKSPEFYINKLYYEADVVISLPCLKNHHIAGITGAIKNVAIGSSPPNIYGQKGPLTVTRATPKYILEKWGPRIILERSKKINHSRFYLGLWMHDYYLCKPPDFVVTDGLQGSQNGPDIPSSCQQKTIEDNQMNMRLILAGKDPIAVDTVQALVMGFDPYKVNHIANLSAFGCADATRLRIQGDPVHTVRKDFELLGGRGRESKLDWTGHPDMQVTSAWVQDARLHLCVKSEPNRLHMLEVLVDGRRREDAILGGFEHVVLDLGPTARAVQEVTVCGYDRYLHYAEQTVKVTPEA